MKKDYWVGSGTAVRGCSTWSCWRCHSSCPPPSPESCLWMLELLGSSAHAAPNAVGGKQIFFFSNQSCTMWEVKLKTGLLSISSSMPTVYLPQHLQEQPPSSAHSYCILHMWDNFPHTQLAHSQIPAQLQQQTQLDLTAWAGSLQQYRLTQAIRNLLWRAVLAQKDLTPKQVHMYFLQEQSLPTCSPAALCSTPKYYKTPAEALLDFSKPFVRIMAVQGKGGKGTKSLLSPETTHYTNLCT